MLFLTPRVSTCRTMLFSGSSTSLPGIQPVPLLLTSHLTSLLQYSSMQLWAHGCTRLLMIQKIFISTPPLGPAVKWECCPPAQSLPTANVQHCLVLFLRAKRSQISSLCQKENPHPHPRVISRDSGYKNFPTRCLPYTCYPRIDSTSPSRPLTPTMMGGHGPTVLHLPTTAPSSCLTSGHNPAPAGTGLCL